MVTPELKYYAFVSPRYSSDRYMVENLHCLADLAQQNYSE